MIGRNLFRFVFLATVCVFLVIIVIVWQKARLFINEGELVGVATVDGAIYFGELVFSDEKSIVIRDVYIAAGLSAPMIGTGMPAEKLSFRVNKYGGMIAPELEGGEDTLTLSRSQVLFISREMNPVVVETIGKWVAPTPVPTPEPVDNQAYPVAVPEEMAPPTSEQSIETAPPSPHAPQGGFNDSL